MKFTARRFSTEFKSEKYLRETLVKSAFLHAKKVGFNDNCLVEACKDFGYPSVTASVVRKGPIEVVDFAMATWLRQLNEDLPTKSMEEIRLKSRIHLGIKTRLQYVQPYQDVWPQAMALGLQPYNIKSTLHEIHAISDAIWHHSGDKAVDFSWYTKRALVSNIYALTEVYMMQDKSEDKQSTWDFLDRRIEHVMAVGGILNQNQNLVNAIGTGFVSIFSILKPTKFDDSSMKK